MRQGAWACADPQDTGRAAGRGARRDRTVHGRRLPSALRTRPGPAAPRPWSPRAAPSRGRASTRRHVDPPRVTSWRRRTAAGALTRRGPRSGYRHVGRAVDGRTWPSAARSARPRGARRRRDAPAIARAARRPTSEAGQRRRRERQSRPRAPSGSPGPTRARAATPSAPDRRRRRPGSSHGAARRARAAVGRSSRAAGGVQPQLDPQQPVVAQRRPARQALVDHAGRRAAAGAAARPGADADVAGQLVGVLERLGQQRVTGGEVVVQQRGGDAGLLAIRAMRTSLIPSRAIGFTAASRIRWRARAPGSRVACHAARTLATSSTPHGGHDDDRPRTRRRTTRLRPAERARAFVDEVLIPREVEAERAGGRLRAEDVALIRREALAREISAAGCTAPSTAGRAGPTSSGSWSRSSSGARPTRSPGTSRPPTTCSRTARRADRPLAAPGAARRAARRLRGHRGARGLRPVGHRHDRDARPTAAGGSTARSGSSPTATSRPSTSSWRWPTASAPTLFLVEAGLPGI